MSADKSLVAALQALWDIPPPGPQHLWGSPERVALMNLLAERYTDGKKTFGLDFSIDYALRSLGLPCSAPHLPNHPRPNLNQVAAKLAHEFQRTTTRRRYLCPLDMADELPTFQFGNAKMGRFTAAELEDFFDAPRLERCYPGIQLDARNLSQFHWLVVEEDVSVRSESGNRQFSWPDLPIGKDLGEVVPHSGRFPAVVERALFFLLLAPWEDWAEMPEVDWRGFRVPWIYTLDDDLFAFPPPRRLRNGCRGCQTCTRGTTASVRTTSAPYVFNS
ncbi:hypothetical protein ACQYYZ_19470 [Pseudomonas aeruginosa]|uniref:hypothetical protein n=1 Tax=Pseudomonas aeruginosa TaxID=287 RepID=UPI003D295960